MTRTDIINAEIKRGGYKSYLEIGVRNPADNFDKVNCDAKVGVDPCINTGDRATRDWMYSVTSDEFFEPPRTEEFDLIFIDGDHSYEQVQKDVKNALEWLSEGGCIIMHDCLPKNAKEAADEKPSDGTPWCGGAWRVYAEVLLDTSLQAYVVNCDHGVAVIRKHDRGMVKDLEGMQPWEMSDFSLGVNYNMILTDFYRTLVNNV